MVLGFPANDFAGQEPRSNREIGEFCRANFGVSFPMFAKLKMTGEDAHPSSSAGRPDWNFDSTYWIAAAGWWSAGGRTPSPTIRPRSPGSSTLLLS